LKELVGSQAITGPFGDFDYNGFVDDDDVTLLGAFYDPSDAPLVSGGVVSGEGVAAVPERSTAALVVLLLAAATGPAFGGVDTSSPANCVRGNVWLAQEDGGRRLVNDTGCPDGAFCAWGDSYSDSFPGICIPGYLIVVALRLGRRYSQARW
jgi:hypothetical protein